MQVLSRAGVFVALVSILSLGCDPSPADPDAGSERDAGPTDAGPPPVCADRATRFVFPSPYWESADGLRAPTDDLGGDSVRAQGWEAELSAIDAWPRRPSLVIPLDRAADESAIDASKVHAAVFEADAYVAIDLAFHVRLRGDALVIQPRDPFPPDAMEVIVALEEGVAGDARPLGACDGDAVHLAYTQAANGWPGDETIALAMRLRLADTAAPMLRLRERLEATPALTVLDATATALADLGDDAPDAAMAPHFASPVLVGQLELPEYRDPDGGPMTLDADGGLHATGVTRPQVVVALPSTGSAPYPVVLYQHGGGGSPLDLFELGGQLAEAGFAFVAIDLPEHGLRGPIGGGSELDFLDFDSPQRTRENFRQTIADHLAVLSGLDALNASLEAKLSVIGALDATRTFYMGMSLGGVSGSMTAACSRGLDGAAVFVGGGGYPEMMGYGLFAVAAARILRGAEPRPSFMLAVVETIADAADPLAYALAAEDRGARPTPMLFMQANEDPLLGAEANDQWARAFGASLARPIQHAVEAMAEVDLPIADTMRFAAGGEASTRVLVHNPMTEIAVADRHGGLVRTDYMQAMVTRCFTTIRDTGSCEVIDTGFASR
jgi:dienelactone hydrolase